MSLKTLWIKEKYLDQILTGRKTVEVRVAYDNIASLKEGDCLLLNEKHPFLIQRIGRYADFQEMLQNENSAAIAPDVPSNQLLNRIREIYPAGKENLGVVALQIKPLPELQVHFQRDLNEWPKIPGEDYSSLLASLVHSNVRISSGPVDTINANYHLLIGGTPDRDHLAASSDLHTMIIPWTGLSTKTQGNLQNFPEINVHNMHYNAIPVAEMTVTLLLSAAKLVIEYDHSLRKNDWSLRYEIGTPSMLLAGKNALILGYGAIGKPVAKSCQALGMNIIAVRRNPSRAKDKIANEIHPLSALPALLPQAHALIICLPLTEETENLIDETALSLMPDGSVLVNIGRGPIVAEKDLYNALSSGKLRGAGLDVWYNYPKDKASRTDTPPANYPFQELKNVVMSPHRSSHTSDTERLRLEALVKLINLAAAGQPLPNRVNVAAGY